MDSKSLVRTGSLVCIGGVCLLGLAALLAAAASGRGDEPAGAVRLLAKLGLLVAVGGFFAAVTGRLWAER